MGRWWLSLAATVVSLVALAIAANIGSAWIMQSEYVVGWIISDQGIDAVNNWVTSLDWMIEIPEGKRIEALASVNGLPEALAIYSLAGLPNGSIAALAMHVSSEHWILFLWGARYGVDLGVAPLAYYNMSAPIPMSWCGSGICVVEVVNGSYGYAIDLINVSSSGVARARLFTCRLGVAISVPSYYNGTLFLGVYCNNGSRSIYGFVEVSGSRLSLYNVTSMPRLPHFIVRTRLFFDAGNVSFVPCSIHPLHGDVYISGSGSKNTGTILIHIDMLINESKTWLITKLGGYRVYGQPAYSAIYGGMLVMPLALSSSSGFAFGEIDLDLATDLITGYATPLSLIRGIPNLTLWYSDVVGTNGTIALYNLYFYFYNSTSQMNILDIYLAVIKAPRTFSNTVFVYNTRFVGKVMRVLDREVSYSIQSPTIVELSYVSLTPDSVGKLTLVVSTPTSTNTNATSTTSTSAVERLSYIAPMLAVALIALLLLARRGSIDSVRRY